MEKRNSTIAGISHPNPDGSLRIQFVRDFAKRGASLFLVPEPKNKFDNHAIGLWIDTPAGRQQIGYVSSSDRVDDNVPLNTDLLHWLRSNTITCNVTKVLEINTEYPKVHVEYRIYKAGETVPLEKGNKSESAITEIFKKIFKK